MTMERDEAQDDLGLQEKIKALIMQGEFEIGAKISEDQLAQRFETGKARVRRALDQLAAIGIVQIRPRIGTFVFALTSAEFDHLNTVRALLECAAIQIAMSVAPRPFVSDMRLNIKKMETLDINNDYRLAYQQLDREFHRLSFTYAGNHYLIEAYETLHIKIWTMRSLLTFPLSHYSASFAAHREVFEYLERGEVTAACERLQEHIRLSFSERARALLSEPSV